MFDKPTSTYNLKNVKIFVGLLSIKLAPEANELKSVFFAKLSRYSALKHLNRRRKTFYSLSG
jgi:hypothetical protein